MKKRHWIFDLDIEQYEAFMKDVRNTPPRVVYSIADVRPEALQNPNTEAHTITMSGHIEE